MNIALSVPDGSLPAAPLQHQAPARLNTLTAVKAGGQGNPSFMGWSLDQDEYQDDDLFWVVMEKAVHEDGRSHHLNLWRDVVVDHDTFCKLVLLGFPGNQQQPDGRWTRPDRADIDRLWSQFDVRAKIASMYDVLGTKAFALKAAFAADNDDLAASLEVEISKREADICDVIQFVTGLSLHKIARLV